MLGPSVVCSKPLPIGEIVLESALTLDIVSGPAIIVLYTLSAVIAAYLLLRRPTRRWVITVLIAFAVGGTCAVAIWFFGIRVFHLVDIPLSRIVYAWLAATLVGVCLAIVNLWRSRWWRKVIASIGIVAFLTTGTVAVNAWFGLDRSLGAFLGVTVSKPIALAPLSAPTAHSKPVGPLWKTWIPPADIPAKGTIGTVTIPGTISGFTARPAGLYLPPAALVADPPPLPLVVMMMGQPGDPDPSYTAGVLDALAAQHHGLAPIVIVADQLGNPNTDTLCLDTPQLGNIETYITQDVVNWAIANLNVTKDHRYWTVAGYSNGGECALSFLIKHQKLWSNVLDISGEEIPGADDPAEVLATIFNGDQAAYDAVKPLNILSSTKLPGTFGVFTVGSNDSAFVPGQRQVAAATKAAGMISTYYEVPNGGHVLPALTDGLQHAYQLLYVRLGLAPPS
ncbi:alpha/beta hydrolase [Rathayibacter soli]|uniref:alpha/beta hydrolase n=1 Tax=Rathayibacter soli TaxID=3144168 RepID=UPI0027E59C04|nr:esterase [Glaciibacter superstes]